MRVNGRREPRTATERAEAGKPQHRARARYPLRARPVQRGPAPRSAAAAPPGCTAATSAPSRTCPGTESAWRSRSAPAASSATRHHARGGSSASGCPGSPFAPARPAAWRRPCWRSPWSWAAGQALGWSPSWGCSPAATPFWRGLKARLPRTTARCGCWEWTTSLQEGDYACGTILVDLERREVVDLLPERSPSLLKRQSYGRAGVELLRARVLAA